ncbi:helix-turn-helix transcriptional regulator [Tistrella bauzanensis]|uniref:helix-turn-helix domain-containing protein n=1 Tax=Tistrella TaxID=171436 RepID=UPI0031F717EF
MDIGNYIGTRIKAFREARGLTQAQLAQLMYKNVETISNFERGRVVTSVRTLEKLAHVLNVQIADFFTDIDPGEGETPALSESAIKVLNGVKLLPEEDVELLAGIVGVLERRRSSSV